jgi:hypothetical protein
VKEQSHKEEMSAALRGDFQRLRERGVPVELVPQAPEEPTEHSPADEQPQDPPADASPQRRRWLSRLGGR